MRVRPNLFLVGAPKSGTTSFHVYLKHHPDILMSSTKEPTFFGSDLERRLGNWVDNEQEYEACFAGYSNEKWIGESSVAYMVSTRAAAEIHAFDPDARIVMMMRNPIEMMQSLHADRYLVGNETIQHFDDALAVEEERRQGRKIPKSSRNVKMLFYPEVASYGKHQSV